MTSQPEDDGPAPRRPAREPEGLAVQPSPPRERGLAVRPLESGLVLRQTTAEEFLPSVRPWVRLVGLVMVGSFMTGVGLMAVWPYRVVVRGPGQIRPSGETSVINAPVAGRVLALKVRSNQTVQQGQVIAELDRADLEGKRRELAQSRGALERERQALRLRSEAAVKQARQDVRRAEAALRLASTELQRFSQLVDSGAIAPMQLDEKRANFEVARSELDKARQGVAEVLSSQQAELSRLAKEFAAHEGERAQVSRNLGITQVRAPVSGVLYSLSLRNPQQVVAQGQELARIAPSDRDLIAKVLVRSEDIDNLEVGQRADLRLAGCPYPDFGTLRGKVISVSPDALTTTEALGSSLSSPGVQPSSPASTVGYEVTVQPEASQLKAGGRHCSLRAGMDFRADITTRTETVLRFLLRKARLVSGW